MNDTAGHNIKTISTLTNDQGRMTNDE